MTVFVDEQCGKQEDVDVIQTSLFNDLNIATGIIGILSKDTCWISKTEDLSATALLEGHWLVSLMLASTSQDMLHATAQKYLDLAVTSVSDLMVKDTVEKGKGQKTTQSENKEEDVSNSLVDGL